MDKRKLANIIIKDLEEIKNLAEEVADSQEDSSLVIDLALNRARLLCQEIELLRDLAGNSVPLQEETEEDSFEEEEEEVSDISFSDPELEILHFEEREILETEELTEEEDFDEEEEEIVEEDFEVKYQEENEPEIDEEEDIIEEDEIDQNGDEPENADEESEEDEIDQDEDEPENSDKELEEGEIDQDEDEESEEDDLTGTKDEDSDEEEEQEDDETELEEEVEVEEPLQKTNIHVTELKNELQPGIREINIDDLDDDDDLEPMQFSHSPGSSVRPPMREIPKPEDIAPEKKVVGETFQKERSLNDSIGENKSETKLTYSPITSLRAAIGLNDRFIFIREIFDNNSEKYNTIIDKLDKMEQIQEAVEYLKANLTMQKNEASMKFVELLKRRFTK